MQHRTQSSFFQYVIHSKGGKSEHDTISHENGPVFNSARAVISDNINEIRKVLLKGN